jgi:outer membrane protein OmpA-like peptidoglycan-associated protein
MNNPRLYLRLQARDIMMRDRTTETANHFAATAAVHWAFGGKYRDQDLDGVRDWIDKCPNTPIGAHVDANGCPTDADRDSVWDGIDKCPDSPVGCRVDRNGCSVDTDGDGVCDGVDQCANTPKGATVDLHGCPGDADADSVWDGIDQCANTPRGATVDEKGCPLDADRDGVPDGIDQCPSTKAGQAVDEKGCVTQWAINETDLLETGMIRLRDVRFDDGKSQLTDAVRANLDDVGKVLAKWPTLKIEVASHTDEMKTAKASRQLGEARSRAVIDQLTSKFPEIQKTNLTPKGYGGAKSGNTTRRLLEFRVLNLGELKRQLELRRQPPKPPEPSTAPPDSTR